MTVLRLTEHEPNAEEGLKMAAISPRPLTPEQIRDFFEIGFITIPELFSSHEVTTMRGAFNRLYETAQQLRTTQDHNGSRFVLDSDPRKNSDNDVRIHRIVWCGAAEPELLEIGADLRLLVVAGQLLGSESMQQLINQAHFKLPGDGIGFDWHQDSIHRRFGTELWRDINRKGSYVQMIIALDDITDENGPLQFIPYSCRLGHIDVGEKRHLPQGVVDETSAVAPTLSAGGVLAFGPYTIHGSLPNRSTKPRRVLINGYAFPGANSRDYPGDGAGRMLSIR